MASRSKTSKKESPKAKARPRCKDCPVVKEKKLPLVERTGTRGMVDLKFPGFEATFPGTNRSIMVIIVAGICALVIILPVCFYQVFSADPEALERVGDILGSDNKPREPVRVPVQTDDGIEIMEVCPPCPDCEDMGCMDMCPQCQACNCPQCPTCPVPEASEPVPPAMASPLKGYGLPSF